MDLQEALQYFISIASTPAEQEYIGEMFQKSTLSPTDIEFLENIQRRRVEELEQQIAQIQYTQNYLNFEEKELSLVMSEDLITNQEIGDATMSEAFEVRNQEKKTEDNKRIQELQAKLHKK